MMNVVPLRLVGDRVVLAGIGRALVDGEAAIDLVVEGLEQRGLVVRPTGLGQDRACVQFADHLRR